MTINGNDLAYPASPVQNHEASLMTGGLTKREWMATKIMQGILSCQNTYDRNMGLEEVALISVHGAKTLIKELNKGGGE